MQTSCLYHNPRCSKSRAALELLESRGLQPEIVDYLGSPPSREQLTRLLAMLGVAPRGLIRTGEPEYSELGLERPEASDESLIEAMCAHPRLIERPIFVRGNRAVIGRPPERVLELLQDIPSDDRRS